MRVSREKVLENRGRTIGTAARLLRIDGPRFGRQLDQTLAPSLDRRQSVLRDKKSAISVLAIRVR